MENRVKFKIGDIIEFEAEGSNEVIERERNVFVNSILPAAVDAIKHTYGYKQPKQYFNSKENQPLLDSSEIIETTNNEVNIEGKDLSRKSLTSFINEYGQLSNQDFALFAAYYNEKKNEIKMFSSEDIKRYYSEARRTVYSNRSELLRQLVIKGLIMDAPGSEVKNPKQYILTKEGINYVETYKPKEKSIGKKNTSATNRKTQSKVESVYASLSADDLNIKDYPSIKAQNGFKEQMILTMYIVFNEKKGDSFSVLDIQCLMTDILGLPASINQINGVFKRNKSWFKSEQDSANKKASRKKLLEGAKDFAKEIIGE